MFLLHLLDNMIAYPIAIYHLGKSGDHIDVENHMKENLTYCYEKIVHDLCDCLESS